MIFKGILSDRIGEFVVSVKDVLGKMSCNDDDNADEQEKSDRKQGCERFLLFRLSSCSVAINRHLRTCFSFSTAVCFQKLFKLFSFETSDK